MLVENESYQEALSSLSDKIDNQAIARLNKYGETLNYPSEYIARGLDSIVFREGKYAIKLYCRPALKIPIEKQGDHLTDYMDITNQLVSITENEGTVLSLPYEKFNIRVNPILSIDYNEHFQCFVGISPFIPGASSPTRTESKINEIASLWMKELSVTGISILLINTKYVSPTKIVITDLCTHIKNLAHTK
ncbi:MAG TPA: hypothetical protein VG895_00655 [Patescibacteria group bacterium]|nr:hypothetical protein [Patescibacteria group bacterium]